LVIDTPGNLEALVAFAQICTHADQPPRLPDN
jgi:hypothetical protein